jgi:ATP synthase protein I
MTLDVDAPVGTRQATDHLLRIPLFLPGQSDKPPFSKDFDPFSVDAWIASVLSSAAIGLETKTVEEKAIDKDARKMWAVALRYSALGLEMGVATAIGYGAGWWLDRRLGTKPYLMLVMLLLGIAAGFRSLYRAARRSQMKGDDE